MKGYKVFNPDWTCRDFQYEVGQTYIHNGDIDVCKAGFHFCQKPADCFNYYEFDSTNHVAEIEASGVVKTVNGKSVTDKITIIREIPWHEVLDLVNVGHDCTGLRNTGEGNSGFWNTGDNNTGNWNTGDYNTGSSNTGCGNTGDYNTGNGNTGNWNTGNWNSGIGNAGYGNYGTYNTGDYNTGDYNTGNWNAINYSSGFFNTINQSITAFNKPLEISRTVFLSTPGMQIIERTFKTAVWVPEKDNRCRYLKPLDFKTACRQMWDNFTEEERQAVRAIPNFDPDVFEEITGIDARK